MLEDHVLGIGNVIYIDAVNVDERVDVFDAGGVKRNGTVVDDICIENALLEACKRADENAIWVGENGEDGPARVLEIVGRPKLLAGGGEGARAEVVEDLVVPAEEGRAGP